MNTVLPHGWIEAAWPGNPRVRGLFTGRQGGRSAGPYGAGDGRGGMNLASHVGDDPGAVAANREDLARRLGGALPVWLDQVHGRDLADLDLDLDVDAAGAGRGPARRADASLVTRPGVAASVLVADCLPVLLAAPGGLGVAAAHAGWRGLAAGVLERSAAALAARCRCEPGQLQAWLGPAIGPAHFEVGDEVREAFVAHAATAQQAFVRGERPGKWMADLFALARMRLREAGLAQESLFGGGVCTVSHPGLYYSFRRDRVTGRQAGLVWLV